MKKNIRNNNILNTFLILNFLSILTILFKDFAATYYENYYIRLEVSTYIYFSSGFFPTIVLLGVIILISGVIYNLYKIKENKNNSKLIQEYSNKIKKYSMYSGFILLLGALIFIAYEIFTDDWWWLGVAFYLPFLTNIFTYFYFSKIFEKN